MRQLTISRKSVSSREDLQVLHLKGYINARTNQDFDGALDDLSKEDCSIILDFSKLDYLNSTGLSTMINRHQEITARSRHLILINVPSEVFLVIQQMGLMEMIPLFKDLDEALAFIDKGEDWQGYAAKNFPDRPKRSSTIAPARPINEKYTILTVVPAIDEFVQVLRMRLHNPKARFIVVHDEELAFKAFRKLKPEIVVIRHVGPASDKLVDNIKVNLENPLVSVTKIYRNEQALNEQTEFKIWENDFFVEPFNIMELFALLENEIRRVRTDRQEITQQLNYRFTSTEENATHSSKLAEKLIKASGLHEEAGTRLLSAYNEAIDNARRHGHGSDPSKLIDVIFNRDSKKVSFQITDEGEGFDYETWTKDLQDTTAVRRAQQARRRGQQGGLGILLMYKCCSRVTYFDEGKVLVLEQDLES